MHKEFAFNVLVAAVSKRLADVVPEFADVATKDVVPQPAVIGMDSDENEKSGSLKVIASPDGPEIRAFVRNT
jgi:hypothetical protein